jgi:hypothetical protein
MGRWLAISQVCMRSSELKNYQMRDELEIRGQLNHFHTKISQLMEAATKK